MSRKALKTELHHWWPRGLAAYWQAADGMVNVLRPDGTIIRSPPGSFGAITNAHHIKVGGPWDSTFEPIFNEADNDIPNLVSWLSTLNTSYRDESSDIITRATPQVISVERVHQLSRVLSSLVARSPRTRFHIKLSTEYYRRGFGLQDPTADKSLIAANQRWLYDTYRKPTTSSGRWAILFSDDVELISGDGFFHNFPASQDGFNSHRKCILPLLPTAALVYMLPNQYPTEPKLVTLRITKAEATDLNEMVQVYSSDIIFFRSQPPERYDSFRVAAFQQFKHHQHEYFDSLLDDLSQFNLWGKNGSRSRSRQNVFSSWSKEDKWLSSFLDKNGED